jgi:hypothetical protein
MAAATVLLPGAIVLLASPCRSRPADAGNDIGGASSAWPRYLSSTVDGNDGADITGQHCPGLRLVVTGCTVRKSGGTVR